MALKLDAVGAELPPQSFRYSWQDVVLYALGVGAKSDEIEFLYEGEGPRVLPSFAVVPVLKPCMKLFESLGGELDAIVHHAQKVVTHHDFAPEGEIESTVKLEGVYDLKRMAQAVVTTKSHQGGRLVAETEWSILFLKEGGFGGPRPPKTQRFPVPKDREPSFKIKTKTSEEQAALYRLSGDHNPLHIDPSFAAKVGFDRPILHGLCTFGFVCRAAIKHAAVGRRVASIQGQFRNPVFPGDTLVIAGYNDESGTTLSVNTEERPDEAVLGNARVTFR